MPYMSGYMVSEVNFLLHLIQDSSIADYLAYMETVNSVRYNVFDSITRDLVVRFKESTQ